MSGRILIVEDDAALFAVMRDYLTLSGYQVQGAENQRQYAAATATTTFDLILLDLNLPDSDGLELLGTLRESFDTLLFVVSGRNDEGSRERALELGADDYISKPFSVRELEQRIRNILRRQTTQMKQQMPSTPLPAFGGWRLDEGERCLIHRDGSALQLTRAEYELILLLAAARGVVVTRDHMLDQLGLVAGVGSPETLTALIYRLRRKLAVDGLAANPIVTLSGVGYRLECD